MESTWLSSDAVEASEKSNERLRAVSHQVRPKYLSQRAPLAAYRLIPATEGQRAGLDDKGGELQAREG